MKENGVIFDEAEIGQLVGVLIEECVGPNVKCTKSVAIEYKDVRALLDKEESLAESLAARLVRQL